MIETYFEDVERLALAALFGAIVGLERELRGKEAGLRTLMLVSVGSALFTIVSYRLVYEITGKIEDLTRIASVIVQGIGFLCAGLIFKSDNNVKGLTTAATVWAVAAIGMTVGGGMYALSTAATGLTIVILVGVHYLELLLEQIKLTRTYQIKMAGSLSEEELIKRYFTRKIKLLEAKSFKENEQREFYLTIQAPKKVHQAVVNELIDNVAVIELKY